MNGGNIKLCARLQTLIGKKSARIQIDMLTAGVDANVKSTENGFLLIHWLLNRAFNVLRL
jgi:hypothetical protein